MPQGSLQGHRVALVGRLAAVSLQQARRLLQEHGCQVVPVNQAQWIVVGQGDLPLEFDPHPQLSLLSPEVIRRIDQGQVEVLSEQELWDRLGLAAQQQAVHRLLTVLSLAAAARVPVAVVRRWIRAGLIRPVKRLGPLHLFDFQQVVFARRLAQWMNQGISPAQIRQQLLALKRLVPSWQGPLEQLEVLVRGRRLLLRQDGGLLDAQGQWHFAFASAQWPPRLHDPGVIRFPNLPSSSEDSPEALIREAEALEDQGDWTAAVAAYRRALLQGGPRADLCFRLGELLYTLDDLSAARERYWITLELDPQHLEARLSLGCVLAQLGELELAVAAFRGVIAQEPRVPDAHFHLARSLEQLGRAQEAQPHWQAFLQLAPESPWAQEAQARLASAPADPKAP